MTILESIASKLSLDIDSGTNTNDDDGSFGVQLQPHPLDPLSAGEIAQIVTCIRAYTAEHHAQEGIWFKSVQLLEPPKKELASYLDLWNQALDDGTITSLQSSLARRAEVLVGIKGIQETRWIEFIVTIDNENNKATVDSAIPVADDQHVPADMDELLAAQEAIMNHPEFIAVVDKLGLPKSASVLAEGWIYGADNYDSTPRHFSFMCYLRLDPSSNPDTCHYAAPLPIIPTILADTFELVKIEYCPILGLGDKTILDLEENFPWEKYAPSEYEYDPAIREKAGLKVREGLKPYQVIQPEGASFTIQGRVLKWQKWSLHIGFNYREGPVLSDVRYDGRKVFYRLSVSDMTVPYGDPRSPYHRKQAFDLGDVGAGLTANELQLGCDCLGEILYLDYDHFDSKGSPIRMKGVICIHEQDDGIGWKHTSFHTGNATVTRSRVLIIQTIITVANYEYVFAWKLDQAAGLHLETRATGILSTAAILPGETSPYGTVVAPGVLGTNHQHLFSVRIDPSIDGHENTVVQEDSVPMPFDKLNPPQNNKYGVGYTVEKTPITISGWADAAPEKNRVFKITNPNKINPISGRPVSYKLVPAPSQLLLAHPDSVAFARAEFGDHHIYVTSHKDGELYSGGRFTNQSNGNSAGIRTWVARKDNVENTDIVLWHTFGLTHNPRVEDFPVMPCETHMISLKPNDFFTTSPAIDVPVSTQAINKSKLFLIPATGHAGVNGKGKGAGAHFQADGKITNEAKVNTDRKGCC